MLRFLTNILRFKFGQKAAKKTARAAGLKWLAIPLGLWAGMKAIRRS
ncbi:MAG: hypothetical protein R3338_14875 [Thermoanaerobaculia bacterium]|nr:hypothetical protein [Thermoanaerobaculia bacterium]